MPDTPDTARPALASQPALRLFLIAFAILLLELILIRWIPIYLRSFGFFTNFALLGALLGIGCGALTHRSARFAVPGSLLMLMLLVVAVTRQRPGIAFTSNEALFYGSEIDADGRDRTWLVPVVFVMLVFVFIPLGRELGRLFSVMRPLTAYAVDILGSLAGIATFVLLSWLSLPPVWWFALFFVAFWPFMAAQVFRPRAVDILAMLVILVMAATHGFETRPPVYVGTEWSPYYRITVTHNHQGSGYFLAVNDLAHQETQPIAEKEPFYFEVYRRLGQPPFKRVLIIGAGSGADVAIALANGAEHVDAVEIDPKLYELGRRLNPERPYDDPRVRVTITDGRAFLRHGTDKYDLIIFALTDSLTLTSAHANIRLESFLFTTEAMREAKARLAPNGALVLYNFYREDWSLQRIAGMLLDVFGTPPYAATYGAHGRAAAFIAGPRLANLAAELDHPYRESQSRAAQGAGPSLPEIGRGRMADTQATTRAVDDWPFFYVQHRDLPRVYAIGIASVLAFSVIFLLCLAPREAVRGFNWHFFFLGVAFMLLETRSLVTFALLFGTTWLVNALVFFAILACVLFAVLLNARLRIPRVGSLYALLLALLALNYLVPTETLLGIVHPSIRYLLASLFAFAPVFVANIVFSHSFRDTAEADRAFAANLIGLVVGGLLEYASLLVGYQALLIGVIASYALAWITLPRRQPAPG